MPRPAVDSALATVLVASGSEALPTVLALVAQTQGGRLCPVDGTAPDEVLATFTSASGAVDAAVDVQCRLAERGAPPARIGLAAGEVVWDALGSCTGEPPASASLLAAAARPGEILARSEVPILAGSRGEHAFVDHLPVDAPGLDGATVVEVRWATDGPAAATLPIPLARAIDPHFAARTEELAALEGWWESACRGRQRVILIRGEPGIGKTTLAAELARRALDDGGSVLFGHCDDEIALPYAPFVEALRAWVHDSHPDDVPHALGASSNELLRLVPALRGVHALDWSEVSGEGDQARLLDAMTTWLDGLAAHRPVLLVLDDLQWADGPTTAMLRRLARSADDCIGGRRLLVVGTFRDTEARAPFDELRRELLTRTDVEMLSLGGLDERAIASIVAAQREMAADDAAVTHLARALRSRSGGNTLFVRELLRNLDAGARDDELPDGLRALVEDRLSRVEDEVRRLLTCAAILGLEFDLATVAGAAGVEPATARRAVLAACDAGLVVAGSADGAESFRFAHEVARAAIDAALTPMRRAHLTVAVARALQDAHPDPDHPTVLHLARLWGAAAPVGHAAPAARWARAAGDGARGLLAYDDAAGWYERADFLTREAGAPTPVALLVDLAEVRLRAGRSWRAAQRSAWDAAMAAGDHTAAVRAALVPSLRFAAEPTAADPALVAMLEQALTIDSLTDTDRARVLAFLARESQLVGAPEATRALVQSALATARTSGDRHLLAEILLQASWLFRAPELHEQRTAFVAQLVALPPDRLDPVHRSAAHTEAAWLALETGDREGFDANRLAVQDLESALNRGESDAINLDLTIAAAYLEGDHERVEQAARRRNDLDDHTEEPDAARVHSLRRAHRHLLAGEWAAAAHEMAESVTGAGPVTEEMGPAVGLAMWAAWHGGDDRRARRLLIRLFDDGLTDVRRGPSRLAMASLAGWVAAEAGQLLTTRALLELLLPHRGRLLLLPGQLPFVPIDAILAVMARTVPAAADEAELVAAAHRTSTLLRSPALDRLVTLLTTP